MVIFGNIERKCFYFVLLYFLLLYFKNLFKVCFVFLVSELYVIIFFGKRDIIDMFCSLWVL